MSVFRVEKNHNYTVMSNHHLKNKELSLKAKGLLSQMLSLPDDWDYTLSGLARLNREKVDAIRTAIWELEKHGYITRHQPRNANGKMAKIEYVIYETPQEKTPMLENPISVKPSSENPITVNSSSEKSTSENPTQLNTNIIKTNKSNTDLLNTNISNPILSNPKKDMERIGIDDYEAYTKIIKENIEYDIMAINYASNIYMLDEIVELMVETVCTSKEYLTIAGDDYPSSLVKSKFLKLTSEHIEYVMDCLKENTSNVRNIKKYLLAMLFNALTTIDSYYTAKVNHDIHGGGYE